MDNDNKEFIKQQLKEKLSDFEKQNDADLISKEQAQQESKKDIVEKSEDNSILTKEDK